MLSSDLVGEPVLQSQGNLVSVDGDPRVSTSPNYSTQINYILSKNSLGANSRNHFIASSFFVSKFCIILPRPKNGSLYNNELCLTITFYTFGFDLWSDSLFTLGIFYARFSSFLHLRKQKKKLISVCKR